jgi:predicted transcriptional regulator
MRWIDRQTVETNLLRVAARFSRSLERMACVAQALQRRQEGGIYVARMRRDVVGARCRLDLTSRQACST